MFTINFKHLWPCYLHYVKQLTKENKDVFIEKVYQCVGGDEWALRDEDVVEGMALEEDIVEELASEVVIPTAKGPELDENIEKAIMAGVCYLPLEILGKNAEVLILPMEDAKIKGSRRSLGKHKATN